MRKNGSRILILVMAILLAAMLPVTVLATGEAGSAAPSIEQTEVTTESDTEDMESDGESTDAENGEIEEPQQEPTEEDQPVEQSTAPEAEPAAPEAEQPEEEDALPEDSLIQAFDAGDLITTLAASPTDGTFTDWFVKDASDENGQKLAQFVAHACGASVGDTITTTHISNLKSFDANDIKTGLNNAGGNYNAIFSNIDALAGFTSLESIQVHTQNTQFDLSDEFVAAMDGTLTELCIRYFACAADFYPDGAFKIKSLETLRLLHTAGVGDNSIVGYRIASNYHEGTGVAIPKGSEYEMSNLKTLQVTGLKTLPDDLAAQFPNATTLGFSHGYLMEMTSTLPPNLESLDISFNFISAVSDEIRAASADPNIDLAITNVITPIFNQSLVGAGQLAVQNPSASSGSPFTITIPRGAAETKLESYYTIMELNPATLEFEPRGNVDSTKLTVDTSYDHTGIALIRIIGDNGGTLMSFKITVQVGAGGDFSDGQFAFESGGGMYPIVIKDQTSGSTYTTMCLDQQIVHSEGIYAIITDPQEIADNIGIDLEGLYRLRYAFASTSNVLSPEELQERWAGSSYTLNSETERDAFWAVIRHIKGLTITDTAIQNDLGLIKPMYDPTDDTKVIEDLNIDKTPQTVTLTAAGTSANRKTGESALLGPYTVNTAPVSATLLFDAAVTPSGSVKASDLSIVDADGAAISGKGLVHGDEFYVKVAPTAGDGSVSVALKSQSDTVNAVYREYLFIPGDAGQRVYGLERTTVGVSANAEGIWSTSTTPSSSSSSSSAPSSSSSSSSAPSSSSTPSSSVPSSSSSPDSTTQPSSTPAPQTGDNSPIAVFILLAAACALGIPTLLIVGKSQRRARKR